MNRQRNERSSAHPRRAKVSSRYSPRPALAAATLIAFFLLTLSLTLILSPRGSVSATTESINTYAADCSTPQPGNAWNLGGAACAVATGSTGRRSIVWTAPNGNVAQRSGFFSGDGSDTYAIPTTGDFAQVGTWSVRSVNVDGDSVAAAKFIVRDPSAATADLSITKSGPAETSAGAAINYVVSVYNLGPDAAQNVRVTDATPANTTFGSATQNSGPAFTCTTSNGVTTCTTGAGGSLAAGDTATFTFLYSVNGGTPDGTVILNTASVVSDTTEPQSQRSDDSATTQATVTSASTPPCTIACPSDITTNNDPQAANPCVAVVNYTTPTASGNCTDPDTGRPADPVTCSPPSGAAFPVGTTPVTCNNGVFACNFNVIVNETRQSVQPTISCPSDMTVPEQPTGSGFATVTFAPTVTGNCANTTCTPPSGSSFSVGTTTVNCTAADSSNQSVSCSFTVTVTSTTGPCTLTCPTDITQTAASGQCSAVVTYSAPATNGDCGTVTCDPPSGSTFQAGATAVTCTSSQGPSCSFTVTVIAPAPPTITACASNRTLSVNANCEATIPNMLGEVHTTGCSVTVSQSPTPGTIVGPGTYTVTFTAENSACDPGAVPSTCPTCAATVTVADTTPPVITSSCPAGTSASANSNCQAFVPNVIGGVTATDNCTDAGSLTITQSPAAGTLVGPGTTTITITVRDLANNAATCATTFTVSDTTPPTAVCKNITVPLDANGNASITAADVDNGSSDNCGIVSRTVSQSAFTCANKGANTVTLTVKDAANNTSTCLATVTVVDTTPPSITCQADIIADFDSAVNGAVVTYTTPVGTDNCSGATTTQIAGLASGSTFPAGSTTNTFRVTDTSGNTAQCSFKVTVAITSIVGLDSISITGSALVDSYNSSGGFPATQGNLANVLSNGTITLGNSGRVGGNVRSTRAGIAMSGASQVTGNATAGTTVSRSGSATVGGTITNNQLAPVMTLPSVPACSPYSSNSGITGTYTYNQSTGDLSLSGVNIATLANGTYCFHNITLTNSAQLKVNGLVVIKLTGTLNASGATSFSNTTGTPGNLRILSSYTGTTGVTIGNSTNVQLVIYAPGTGVSISGSSPVFGTVVGKTVTLSNSGMLHYDTQLKNIWPDIWSLIQ
jgi:uncharacterized repeat protein (TIGR01451 family)